MLAEFLEHDHRQQAGASRLGPAQPRGVTWNGAGAWLTFSHARQENFSRTCWMTFQLRGITSRFMAVP